MSSGGEVTGCSLSPMKPQRSAGSRTGTGHSRHFPPSGPAVLPVVPTGGRPLFPHAVPGRCPAGSRRPLAAVARPPSGAPAPVFRAGVPRRCSAPVLGGPVPRPRCRTAGRNSTGGRKPPRGARTAPASGAAGGGRGRCPAGEPAGVSRGSAAEPRAVPRPHRAGGGSTGSARGVVARGPTAAPASRARVSGRAGAAGPARGRGPGGRRAGTGAGPAPVGAGRGRRRRQERRAPEARKPPPGDGERLIAAVRPKGFEPLTF